MLHLPSLPFLFQIERKRLWHYECGYLFSLSESGTFRVAAFLLEKELLLSATRLEVFCFLNKEFKTPFTESKTNELEAEISKPDKLINSKIADPKAPFILVRFMTPLV